MSLCFSLLCNSLSKGRLTTDYSCRSNVLDQPVLQHERCLQLKWVGEYFTGGKSAYWHQNTANESECSVQHYMHFKCRVWLLTESQISPVIESNSLLHRCYFLTQMGMTLTKRAKQGRNSLESCCILWWDDSMEKNVREYLMSLLLPYCGDIWLKIFYATKYLVQ